MNNALAYSYDHARQYRNLHNWWQAYAINDSERNSDAELNVVGATIMYRGNRNR